MLHFGLTGGQNRRRHLVEQGLKQVVIRAIDQDDFRGRVLESLGGGQSSETADHDYYMWQLMCHDLQCSDVCFCR
jgi:hypothetical protein